MRLRFTLLVALLSGLWSAAQKLDDPSATKSAPQAMELDLSKAFHTRSPWRFVVTEGPAVKDIYDRNAPGILTLCLHKGSTGPCIAAPVNLPLNAPSPYYAIAWEPHYLIAAKPVYPRGLTAAPLLLIVTGSLYSGDGDRLISTQLVTNDASRDAFRRVFGKSTGHNNNEEIRFITDGPLRGSVISAEPQEHPPYGYWIVVSQFTSAGVYRQVLRYASATRYNDGNPLAVIDSEMPNIERRLGLWKPGDPIPTPQHNVGGKPCIRPTLRHGELWCE